MVALLSNVTMKIKRVYSMVYIYEVRSISGPGSVVGIATAYGLDDPGIDSLWGEIFRISPDRL